MIRSIRQIRGFYNLLFTWKVRLEIKKKKPRIWRIFFKKIKSMGRFHILIS
jgi:hypothetical protein